MLSVSVAIGLFIALDVAMVGIAMALFTRRLATNLLERSQFSLEAVLVVVTIVAAACGMISVLIRTG